MSSLPWKPMAYLALAVLFIAVVFVPDPNARTFSTLTTEELIATLASPREAVRRAATGQLIARAKTVVPHLLEALPAAGESQRHGMFDVLEELLLSADPEVAESAESALEWLSLTDDRDTADDAIRLLMQNATLRHGRAIVMFTDLGGQLEAAALTTRASSRESIAWGGSRALGSTPQPLAILDGRWQGGDQGLKYLARMFPSDTLAVHLTHDAPVSEAGLARLRTSRQYVLIRREFESCLGIVLDPRSLARLVTVGSVIADSPADRAGLQAGDAILSIEGESIREFEDVGRQTTSHRPGDYVRLTLRRNGQTIRLRMPLAGSGPQWRSNPVY